MISVIIPAYNCEATLERTVRSVMAQTYADYEVLIVNDGSTDATEDLALSLSREDARIRCFTTENGGVSCARNFGIDHARGDHICFIDSDDTVEPFYLASLISLAGDGVMPCVGYAINDDEIPYRVGDIPSEYWIEKSFFEDFFIGKLRQPIAYAVWNKLFCTAVLRENGIRFSEDLYMGEDLLFVVRYLFCCNRIAYCSSPLYHYFIYPTSVVRRANENLLGQYESIYSRLKNPESVGGEIPDDILCYWSLESLSVILSNRHVKEMPLRVFRRYCLALFNSPLYKQAIRCDRKCSFGRSLLRSALRLRSKILLYLLLKGAKS